MGNLISTIANIGIASHVQCTIYATVKWVTLSNNMTSQPSNTSTQRLIDVYLVEAARMTAQSRIVEMIMAIKYMNPSHEFPTLHESYQLCKIAMNKIASGTYSYDSDMERTATLLPLLIVMDNACTESDPTLLNELEFN